MKPVPQNWSLGPLLMALPLQHRCGEKQFSLAFLPYSSFPVESSEDRGWCPLMGTGNPLPSDCPHRLPLPMRFCQLPPPPVQNRSYKDCI